MLPHPTFKNGHRSLSLTTPPAPQHLAQIPGQPGRSSKLQGYSLGKAPAWQQLEADHDSGDTSTGPTTGTCSMAGITPITQPLLEQDGTDKQPKKFREMASEEQDQARVYPMRSHASATHQTQGVESGAYAVLELYDNISLRTDRWNLCLKNIDHEFYFRDMDGIWRPLSDFDTSRLPNRPIWKTPADTIRPLDIDYSTEDLQLRSLRHMSARKPAKSEPRLGEMKQPDMKREKANGVTDTRPVSASRIEKAAPATGMYKGSSATGPNLARRPVKIMRAQAIPKPLNQLSLPRKSDLPRKPSMSDRRLMPLDGSQDTKEAASHPKSPSTMAVLPGRKSYVPYIPSKHVSKNPSPDAQPSPVAGAPIRLSQGASEPSKLLSGARTLRKSMVESRRVEGRGYTRTRAQGGEGSASGEPL